VADKNKSAKTTKPNLKVLLEGVQFEKCPKHRSTYVKGGVCPTCAAEKKGK
jgi:hypothetical protein